MKFICPLLLALLFVNDAFSLQKEIDTSLVKPGRPLPRLEINHISDFSSTQANTDQFRGKWLLLDFWNKGCASCVASFPAINTEQQKYRRQLQYLLVATQEESNATKKIYAKFKDKLHLDIPNAYDSALFRQLQITGCPRIIVIRPDGVVYGTATHITDETLSGLIAGQSPALEDAYLEAQNNQLEQVVDLNAIDDNNDSSLLYKSALNKWNPSIRGFSCARIVDNSHHFETVGTTLTKLYLLAYLAQDGMWKSDHPPKGLFNHPIIEVADKKKFDTAETYCYRVTVPINKNSRENIMKMMQSDLRNYFGYEVAMEERTVPCWKLTASKTARTKLKTKGAPRSHAGRRDTGMVFINYPIQELVNKLSYIDLPIIDLTGIKGNIDLALKHMMLNKEDLLKNMEENGLFLEKSTVRMKAFVIKDSPHREIVQVPLQKYAP